MRRSAMLRQLGDGDAGEVERERHRLAVEVAARDHLVAVSAKTSGLSVADVDLGLEHVARKGERVARGAVNLRHAAQRIGVLHLVAVSGATR